MTFQQVLPCARVQPRIAADNDGWMAQALDSARVLDHVKTAWTDPDEEVVSLACERFFPSAKATPLMVYTARLAGSSGERQCRLFAVRAQGQAVTLRDGIVASLRKSRRHQVAKHDPVHQIVALPGLDMVLRPQGLDEKIDGLGLLHTPERMGPGWTSASLLVHRLHKRAVLRLGNAETGGSIVVKVFRNHGDQHIRLQRISRFLQSSAFNAASRVGVPAILDDLPEGLTGLAFEDVGGTELGQLRGAQLHEGTGIAGQSVGRLHRLPLRLREEHGPEEECALLQMWCAVTARAFPHAAGTLNLCMAHALRRLQAADGFEPAVIHRDLHEKQLLVSEQRAWLIDFDTFAMGDPAQDVGNFIAHLRWAAMFDQAIRPELCDAFFDGYASSTAPASRDHVDAHLYASLLRIACIHAFSEQRRETAFRLLEEIVP